MPAIIVRIGAVQRGAAAPLDRHHQPLHGVQLGGQHLLCGRAPRRHVRRPQYVSATHTVLLAPGLLGGLHASFQECQQVLLRAGRIARRARRSSRPGSAPRTARTCGGSQTRMTIEAAQRCAQRGRRCPGKRERSLIPHSTALASARPRQCCRAREKVPGRAVCPCRQSQLKQACRSGGLV